MTLPEGVFPRIMTSGETLYQATAKIKDRVRLEPTDVRVLVRAQLRRLFEDNDGRELACDFQDDRQLQQAILELLKRLSGDPRTLPSYASFAPTEELKGENAEEAETDEIGAKPPGDGDKEAKRQ